MVRSSHPGSSPEWKKKWKKANQERYGDGNGNPDETPRALSDAAQPSSSALQPSRPVFRSGFSSRREAPSQFVAPGTTASSSNQFASTSFDQHAHRNVATGYGQQLNPVQDPKSYGTPSQPIFKFQPAFDPKAPENLHRLGVKTPVFKVPRDRYKSFGDQICGHIVDPVANNGPPRASSSSAPSNQTGAASSSTGSNEASSSRHHSRGRHQKIEARQSQMTSSASQAHQSARQLANAATNPYFDYQQDSHRHGAAPSSSSGDLSSCFPTSTEEFYGSQSRQGASRRQSSSSTPDSLTSWFQIPTSIHQDYTRQEALPTTSSPNSSNAHFYDQDYLQGPVPQSFAGPLPSQFPTSSNAHFGIQDYGTGYSQEGPSSSSMPDYSQLDPVPDGFIENAMYTQLQRAKGSDPTPSSSLDPNAVLPGYVYLHPDGYAQEYQPYSSSSQPPPYRPSTCSRHDYGYGQCQCMDDCRPGVGWTWNYFDNSWMPPFDDSPDCIAFRKMYERERVARDKYNKVWQEEKLLIMRVRNAKIAKAKDKENARAFKERRKRERALQKIKDEEELQAKFRKAGFRVIGDVFEAKRLIEERRFQLLAQFYWNGEKKKEIFEERKKDVRLLMDDLLTKVEEEADPVRLVMDKLLEKVVENHEDSDAIDLSQEPPFVFIDDDEDDDPEPEGEDYITSLIKRGIEGDFEPEVEEDDELDEEQENEGLDDPEQFEEDVQEDIEILEPDDTRDQHAEEIKLDGAIIFEDSDENDVQSSEEKDAVDTNDALMPPAALESHVQEGRDVFGEDQKEENVEVALPQVAKQSVVVEQQNEEPAQVEMLPKVVMEQEVEVGDLEEAQDIAVNAKDEQVSPNALERSVKKHCDAHAEHSKQEVEEMAGSVLEKMPELKDLEAEPKDRIDEEVDDVEKDRAQNKNQEEEPTHAQETIDDVADETVNALEEEDQSDVIERAVDLKQDVMNDVKTSRRPAEPTDQALEVSEKLLDGTDAENMAHDNVKATDDYPNDVQDPDHDETIEHVQKPMEGVDSSEPLCVKESEKHDEEDHISKKSDELHAETNTGSLGKKPACGAVQVENRQASETDQLLHEVRNHPDQSMNSTSPRDCPEKSGHLPKSAEKQYAPPSDDQIEIWRMLEEALAFPLHGSDITDTTQNVKEEIGIEKKQDDEADDVVPSLMSKANNDDAKDENGDLMQLDTTVKKWDQVMDEETVDRELLSLPEGIHYTVNPEDQTEVNEHLEESVNAFASDEADQKLMKLNSKDSMSFGKEVDDSDKTMVATNDATKSKEHQPQARFGEQQTTTEDSDKDASRPIRGPTRETDPAIEHDDARHHLASKDILTQLDQPERGTLSSDMHEKVVKVGPNQLVLEDIPIDFEVIDTFETTGNVPVQTIENPVEEIEHPSNIDSLHDRIGGATVKDAMPEESDTQIADVSAQYVSEGVLHNPHVKDNSETISNRIPSKHNNGKLIEPIDENEDQVLEATADPLDNTNEGDAMLDIPSIEEYAEKLAEEILEHVSKMSTFVEVEVTAPIQEPLNQVQYCFEAVEPTRTILDHIQKSNAANLSALEGEECYEPTQDVLSQVQQDSEKVQSIKPYHVRTVLDELGQLEKEKYLSDMNEEVAEVGQNQLVGEEIPTDFEVIDTSKITGHVPIQTIEDPIEEVRTPNSRTSLHDRIDQDTVENVMPEKSDTLLAKVSSQDVSEGVLHDPHVTDDSETVSSRISSKHNDGKLIESIAENEDQVLEATADPLDNTNEGDVMLDIPSVEDYAEKLAEEILEHVSQMAKVVESTMPDAVVLAPVQENTTVNKNATEVEVSEPIQGTSNQVQNCFEAVEPMRTILEQIRKSAAANWSAMEDEESSEPVQNVFNQEQQDAEEVQSILGNLDQQMERFDERTHKINDDQISTNTEIMSDDGAEEDHHDSLPNSEGTTENIQGSVADDREYQHHDVTVVDNQHSKQASTEQILMNEGMENPPPKDQLNTQNGEAVHADSGLSAQSLFEDGSILCPKTSQDHVIQDVPDAFTEATVNWLKRKHDNEATDEDVPSAKKRPDQAGQQMDSDETLQKNEEDILPEEELDKQQIGQENAEPMNLEEAVQLDDDDTVPAAKNRDEEPLNRQNVEASQSASADYFEESPRQTAFKPRVEAFICLHAYQDDKSKSQKIQQDRIPVSRDEEQDDQHARELPPHSLDQDMMEESDNFEAADTSVDQDEMLIEADVHTNEHTSSKAPQEENAEKLCVSEDLTPNAHDDRVAAHPMDAQDAHKDAIDAHQKISSSEQALQKHSNEQDDQHFPQQSDGSTQCSMDQIDKHTSLQPVVQEEYTEKDSSGGSISVVGFNNIEAAKGTDEPKKPEDVNLVEENYHDAINIDLPIAQHPNLGEIAVEDEVDQQLLEEGNKSHGNEQHDVKDRSNASRDATDAPDTPGAPGARDDDHEAPVEAHPTAAPNAYEDPVVAHPMDHPDAYEDQVDAHPSGSSDAPIEQVLQENEAQINQEPLIRAPQQLNQEPLLLFEGDFNVHHEEIVEVPEPFDPEIDHPENQRYEFQWRRDGFDRPRVQYLEEYVEEYVVEEEHDAGQDGRHPLPMNHPALQEEIVEDYVGEIVEEEYVVDQYGHHWLVVDTFVVGYEGVIVEEEQADNQVEDVYDQWRIDQAAHQEEAEEPIEDVADEEQEHGQDEEVRGHWLNAHQERVVENIEDAFNEEQQADGRQQLLRNQHVDLEEDVEFMEEAVEEEQEVDPQDEVHDQWPVDLPVAFEEIVDHVEEIIEEEHQNNEDELHNEIEPQEAMEDHPHYGDHYAAIEYLDHLYVGREEEVREENPDVEEFNDIEEDQEHQAHHEEDHRQQFPVDVVLKEVVEFMEEAVEEEHEADRVEEDRDQWPEEPVMEVVEPLEDVVGEEDQAERDGEQGPPGAIEHEDQNDIDFNFPDHLDNVVREEVVGGQAEDFEIGQEPEEDQEEEVHNDLEGRIKHLQIQDNLDDGFPNQDSPEPIVDHPFSEASEPIWIKGDLLPLGDHHDFIEPPQRFEAYDEEEQKNYWRRLNVDPTQYGHIESLEPPLLEGDLGRQEDEHEPFPPTEPHEDQDPEKLEEQWRSIEVGEGQYGPIAEGFTLLLARWNSFECRQFQRLEIRELDLRLFLFNPEGPRVVPQPVRRPLDAKDLFCFSFSKRAPTELPVEYLDSIWNSLIPMRQANWEEKFRHVNYIQRHQAAVGLVEPLNAEDYERAVGGR